MRGQGSHVYSSHREDVGSMTRPAPTNGPDLRGRLVIERIPFAEFTRRLGVHRQTLDKLFRAERFTAGMALRIERALTTVDR